MLVPILDIQGLVYNEYIAMGSAKKTTKNCDDIISELPELEGDQMWPQEKPKE